MHDALKKEFPIESFQDGFKNSKPYVDTSFSSVSMENNVTILKGTAKTEDGCSSLLNFKILDKSISDLTEMSFIKLNEWIINLDKKLDSKKLTISKQIINEISKRINFILDVGLDYLTLNRETKTLSGGESQRIRLATQIGSQLQDVLYILDEPSIGLHQIDNNKLINSLKKLRDIGNTIIVVEHDKDIMLKSDFIVDIGPGAGKNGGNIVFNDKSENINIKGEFVIVIDGKKK